MAYTHFIDDKPVIADNGDIVINNTRENLMALRDNVLMGVIVGWNMTLNIGGGSSEEPDEVLYSDNATTHALKLDITWGTSGGANGNPTVVVYRYSTDDFSVNDDPIGTLTFTYAASGATLTSTWS